MDIMAMSFVGILTKNIQGSNETKKKKVKETPVLCKDRRQAGKCITLETRPLWDVISGRASVSRFHRQHS